MIFLHRYVCQKMWRFYFRLRVPLPPPLCVDERLDFIGGRYDATSYISPVAKSCKRCSFGIYLLYFPMLCKCATTFAREFNPRLIDFNRICLW
jgi:hypothetical protein